MIPGSDWSLSSFVTSLLLLIVSGVAIVINGNKAENNSKVENTQQID